MRLTFLLFFGLSASTLAFAGDAHFTTVFYDDGGIVYVGLKKEEGGKGESQVITFPFQGGERIRIPLPEEIAGRDVIGLVPEKKKLFVLTHGSDGPKDGPMLHLFDPSNNHWKKLGQLACPAFTKVKMTSTHMTFFCENPTAVVVKTKKGKSKKTGGGVTAKSIAYGKDRLYRNGTWRFPEFMLRYKGYNLILEGDAPIWDRLRLKSSEGERLLQANELFQLPTPVSTTPAGPPAPGAPATPAAPAAAEHTDS